MKATIALTALAAAAAQASAACFSTALGYPCCNGNQVVYTDNDGKWGVENGNWCGIGGGQQQPAGCWAASLGYSCCASGAQTVYTDSDGNWGVENGNWCGIVSGGSTPVTPGGSEGDVTIGAQYTHSGNPFVGHTFFLNPYYQDEVDISVAQLKAEGDNATAAKAEKMKEFSNAIWLDNIKNMNTWLERNLKGALAEQNATGKTVLTVFVVYDLPGRDCHALASNGELLANDGDWARYQSEYIDVIEEKLKTYKSQPVVLIVEPDSMANMVTNLSDAPCAASEKYYYDGHAYLIKKLGVLPHVAMYLDIGHAFWLGWDDNRLKAGKVYKKVVDSGAPGKVRGFADNVANYTPWEDPTLSRGPETEWNPCPDEKRYLEAIGKDFKSAGIQSVYFVCDTSRNGKKTDRAHPGEWCNQTGAGIGARPKASPIAGMETLDAFYWIKPLGESDGTSDTTAVRYDGFCGHETAMKPAPEAGQWFHKFFVEGIKNANPAL